jgi:tetratricopeptide (TPR) repeat protein
MALKDLVPPSDLLSRTEGVEAGLRQIRRLGRTGQLVFLLAGALGIVVESGVIGDPAPGSWLAAALRVGPRVLLPLALLLLASSRFWIRHSRHPFRYTCAVSAIGAVQNSPVCPELTWLSQDLKVLLSQRIERLRFVEPTEAGAQDDAHAAHIAIGGTYVIRAQGRDPRSLAIEVMPDVGIGAARGPRTLAHPVIYPSDPVAASLAVTAGARPDEPGRVNLERADYQAILERVYFSVATQIYEQIRADVERKVALMPSSSLAGQALYHEADDYARSNTLNAYDQARDLYEHAARRFDPSLRPLPASRPRRVVARWVRSGSHGLRRLRLRASLLWPVLASRDVACARSLVGVATMLINRRLLATLSGLRINPVFEARSVAEDALARLEALPADAPGRAAARFDVWMIVAQAHEELGSHGEAVTALRRARGIDPARADTDPTFLLIESRLELHQRTRLQILRRAVEARPRFEIAQFLLAAETETLWRGRPAFERTVADMAFREYQLVLDVNPGNMAAWANRGYMRWLLGSPVDLREAHADFQAGRDYKAIKRDTLVAELDYGLARLAAERGDLEEAYGHYVRATSALIGHGVAWPSEYYFDGVSPVMVRRYERYRRAVEEHLRDPARIATISPRVLASVYAFVLNDHGECCHHYYLRTRDSRYLRQARAAFELAAIFNPNYVVSEYNLMRLASEHGDGAEAERHARRIEMLEPKWLPGILSQIEMHTARAVAERRTVERRREDVARLSQQLAGSGGGESPAAGSPATSTDPADRLRAENAARLLDDLARARAAIDRAEAAARAADDEVRRHTRHLVPHDWLWTEGAAPETRARRVGTAEGRTALESSGDLDWAAITAPDAGDDRRWRRELDHTNVRALISYADSVRQQADGAPRAAALFMRLRALYWRQDLALLRGLRECVPAEAAEYDAIIREVIEHNHALAPTSWGPLTWFTDPWCPRERRLEILAAAALRDDLAGELHGWIADQLVRIARDEAAPPATREQARRHALVAARRAGRAQDPDALWAAAVQAARLGDLELCHAAYEQARVIDAGSTGDGTDGAAVPALASPIATASSPEEFREWFDVLVAAARRAEPPSRPPAAYTVIGATVRLLQGRFDEGCAGLRSVSKTAGDAGEWHGALAEPIAALLEAAGQGGVPAAIVDEAYLAVKEALAPAARVIAAGGSGGDRLRAGLALTRRRRPDLEGRRPALVAQATSRNFYPMVTPIAVEVATVLAAALEIGKDSPALEADLSSLQARIAAATGVTVPGVRFRENAGDLPADAYLIMIDEVPVSMLTIPAGQVFQPDPTPASDGDPVGLGRMCAPDGPSGRWVTPGEESPTARAWAPRRYLLEHLERVIRRHLAGLVSVDDVATLLSRWGDSGLTPPQAERAARLAADGRALTDATRVLRAALDEGVPLVAPGLVLEGLHAALQADGPVTAVERLRAALVEWLPGNGAGWHHVRLAPDLEKLLLDGLAPNGAAGVLTLSPEALHEASTAIRVALADIRRAALVVGPARLRPHVRRLVEDEWPGVPVLSLDELVPSLRGRYADLPAASLA